MHDKLSRYFGENETNNNDEASDVDSQGVKTSRVIEDTDMVPEIPALPDFEVGCPATIEEIVGKISSMPVEYADVPNWKYSILGGRTEDTHWKVVGTATRGAIVRDNKVLIGTDVGTNTARFLSSNILNSFGMNDEEADDLCAAYNAAAVEAKAEKAAEVLEYLQTLRYHPAADMMKKRIDSHFDGVAQIEQIIERVVKYGTRSECAAITELHTRMCEARELYVREQAGEILVNWSGYNRSGGNSNHCGHYVIAPNGTFVEPDDELRRRNGDSTKMWHVVEEGNLAVAYHQALLRDPFEPTVALRPQEGITEAQQKALRQIETDNGLPADLWGVAGLRRKYRGQETVRRVEPETEIEPEIAADASVEDMMAALKGKFNR